MQVIVEGTKRCPKCGEVKPLDEFDRDAHKRSGRRSHCRECRRPAQRIYGRRYAATHRDRKREYDRRYRAERRPPRRPPSYSAVHARVADTAPPLAELTCCRCGRQAQQWAYDHSDPDKLVSPRGWPYSLDPWRYMPLCRICHRWLDLACLRIKRWLEMRRCTA